MNLPTLRRSNCMSTRIVTNNQELVGKIKTIVINVSKIAVPPGDISDHANLFDDIGLDSSSVVDLVLALEREFQIRIDEEDLSRALFQDLTSWAALISSKHNSLHQS